MAEPGGRDVIERWVRAIEAKDFDAQSALLADDFIDEMPQSGERTRGKANWLAISRNYPGGVGTVDPATGRVVGAEDRWVITPTFSVLRIEGSGNVYTYAATARYGDGQIWDIVAIIELRDGKIAKSTTWYGAPFPAPEWRAPFVERYTPPGR